MYKIVLVLVIVINRLLLLVIVINRLLVLVIVLVLLIVNFRQCSKVMSYILQYNLNTSGVITYTNLPNHPLISVPHKESSISILVNTK